MAPASLTNVQDALRLPDAMATSVAALERAFGVVVHVWVLDNNWSRFGTHAHSNGDAVYGHLLTGHFDAERPVTVQWRCDRTLVICPLGNCGAAHHAAVCELNSPTGDLLDRLVDAAFASLGLIGELDQMSERLAAYADHVSRETENLCWMQKLATQIENCDPRLGLETVSRTVLSELRELIGAESILLIADDKFRAAGEPSRPAQSTTVGWYGRSHVSAATCQRLIDLLGESARTQPAIGNHVQHNERFHDCPGVRNYLLVPVAAHSDHFGWLLALNKQPAEDFSGEHPQNVSDTIVTAEFGTMEGGLLKAAGILLASHARNALLFQQKEAMMVGIVRALVNTIDAKDAYTFGHSDRVALFAKRIAQKLGYEAQACEQILLTGLLHDIGKIGVPDAVLQKPDKLTNEEFQLIQRHPAVGFNILKHIDQLEYVLDGVLHHHESYDGCGYPHHLAGENIPMVARIIAVADAYDAMTSSRPYRKAMPHERAEAILRENSGRTWDPRVIDAFFDVLDDIHAICGTERDHADQILNPSCLIDQTRSARAEDTVERALASTQCKHLFVSTSPDAAARDAEFHVAG